MKRFVDMEYQRPDFEAEKAARRQYVEQIEQAKSKEELVDVIVKEDERSRMMWTMYDLAYIRNTIDTTDPFYEQEMSNFYKEIGELSLLGQQAEEGFSAPRIKAVSRRNLARCLFGTWRQD